MVCAKTFLKLSKMALKRYKKEKNENKFAIF
jgi:hypothetical protein